MLYYDKIDLSEENDVAKSNNSEEFFVCQHCIFNHGFQFRNSVYNGCHNLATFCLNLGDIAIIIVKNDDYCCIILDISKSESILCLAIVTIYKMHINIKNRISNYSHNLIKSEKLEIENFLMDEKNCKVLVIYFTNYASSKSIKILSLH